MLIVKPRIIEFEEAVGVPNNPALPVLVYEGAVEVESDLASAIE